MAVLLKSMDKTDSLVRQAEGMNIVINRDDLNQLRKERIKIYADNVKNNIKGECDCGCVEKESNGCGCSQC